MRALKEALAGLLRENLKRRDRNMLASQFREKAKGFLGNRSQRIFLLTREQTAEFGCVELDGSATVEIRKERYGLRFAIMTGERGEVIELHGNSPRIFVASYIGENSGRIPESAGVNRLDQEIGWLREWSRRATVLEGLQKNPQAASSAPVAP